MKPSILLLLCSLILSSAAGNIHPNVILILTDDQDLQLGSLDYMPKLQKYIRSKGAFLPNYFIPTPVCCPSRASILRGQYAHNTQIKTLGGDTGGAKLFRSNGAENSTIGSWLHDAGYATAFIGKYLNGYNCTMAPPKYWDSWFTLCDEVYDYYKSVYSVNGTTNYTFQGEYQTDTIGNQALEFFTHNANRPFFIHLSGVAPHAPATPKKIYKDKFNGTAVPRPPSFNASTNTKPSFYTSLPPLSPENVTDITNQYQKRLECLQSVDDNVEAIVNKLTQLNILDNTYIIYTSDNGFHLGEFRLTKGKREPYETDVRVPFFIRGPGIAANINVSINAQNIDIAPTIAEIANITAPAFIDGKSILPYVKNTRLPTSSFRPYVLLEHWGVSSEPENMPNNTWQGLRILNGTENSLYTSWCTSQNEFYNLSTDPYELINRFPLLPMATRNFMDSTLRAYFKCGNVTCRSIVSVSTLPYSSTPLTACLNEN